MSNTVKKLARYFFTGGAAAIVDIGTFELLSSMRVSVVLGAACSFCVAVIVNFILTARWVFGAKATRQSFVLFGIGACVGLLVNVTITSLGVIAAGLPPLVAKTIAVTATFLLNFWINAHWVFRDRTYRSPTARKIAN